MSRYSPTVGPYQSQGGSMLGEYLDFLRSKQYYDYAREEMDFRKEMADQDRQMQHMEMGMEYPNLEYSPNREPGPQRTYQDPVMAGPSIQQQPGRVGLGGAIEDQMAEPGKPVALAGELIPGGFAARNVYRSVSEDPTRYDEMAPGLYRDTKYDPEAGLADEIALRQQAYSGLEDNPAMAELIARDPNLAYSMPREVLFGEPSMMERAQEAYLDDYFGRMGEDADFADYERRLRLQSQLREQEAAADEQRYLDRPRGSTSSGSTSLTNDPEWRSLDYIMRENEGVIDPETAQRLGYATPEEATDRWMGRSQPEPEVRSPQTTIQEIMESGRRALEMYGNTPPESGTERRTTQPDTTAITERRRLGGG